mmetsp:Transcript_24440/g.24021  ORF Transcript_24440/g.24021 Transcript_24440/m.24021 type:complete len:253 (-) Transcript_24440:2130-2888(-)
MLIRVSEVELTTDDLFNNLDCVSVLPIMLSLQLELIQALHDHLMTLPEHIQHLLDSECVSCGVIVLVEGIVDDDGVGSDVVDGVEVLSVQLRHVRVEKIAVVVQKLRQVLRHRIGVLGLEEGRGHEDETVGREATQVGLVEVLALQELLQDQHNGLQVLQLHAQARNVVHALYPQVDLRDGASILVHFCIGMGPHVLKGDVHPQEPHVLVNGGRRVGLPEPSHFLLNDLLSHLLHVDLELDHWDRSRVDELD